MGDLDVLAGGATQGRNDYLMSRLGAAIPAFRGVLSIVARTILYAANNPYLKPWTVRVRRFTAGWYDWPWGSFFAELRDWDADTGAYVTVGNPAHILVQCLTDPHWGLGYSQSALTTSFVVARYALWAEGFGLNLVWTRQQPIESIIAQVLDHIGGVLYLNTWRGAYELKLLRDDYWIDGLPRLGPDEIVRMDRLERAVEGTAQRDHRGLHRLGHGQESDTLETALACVGGAAQLNWKMATGASASALDTVAEEDYAPLLRLNQALPATGSEALAGR